MNNLISVSSTHILSANRVYVVKPFLSSCNCSSYEYLNIKFHQIFLKYQIYENTIKIAYNDIKLHEKSHN